MKLSGGVVSPEPPSTGDPSDDSLTSAAWLEGLLSQCWGQLQQCRKKGHSQCCGTWGCIPRGPPQWNCWEGARASNKPQRGWPTQLRHWPSCGRGQPKAVQTTTVPQMAQSPHLTSILTSTWKQLLWPVHNGAGCDHRALHDSKGNDEGAGQPEGDHPLVTGGEDSWGLFRVWGIGWPGRLGLQGPWFKGGSYSQPGRKCVQLLWLSLGSPPVTKRAHKWGDKGDSGWHLTLPPPTALRQQLSHG